MIPRIIRVALPFGSGTPESKRAPYRRALEAASIEPAENVTTVDGLDGLLLAGGSDIDPSMYGTPRDPRTGRADYDRDSLETALLREALNCVAARSRNRTQRVKPAPATTSAPLSAVAGGHSTATLGDAWKQRDKAHPNLALPLLWRRHGGHSVSDLQRAPARGFYVCPCRRQRAPFAAKHVPLKLPGPLMPPFSMQGNALSTRTGRKLPVPDVSEPIEYP